MALIRRFRRGGRPPALLSLLFSALAVGLGLSTVPTASAATTWSDWKSHNQSYDRSGEFAFPTLAICLKWEIDGTLKYRTRFIDSRIDDSREYEMEDARVEAPHMEVQGFRYSDVSHSCTTTSMSWTDLQATQGIGGYGCSYDLNVSFSVGLPWSFGAGFYPECTNKDAARYTSNWSSGSDKQQLNSDQVLHLAFEEFSMNPRIVDPPVFCVGRYVKLLVETKNGDDTQHTARLKQCTDGTF